jgi:hypothetical protein
MTFARKDDAGKPERAGPVRPKPETTQVDLNTKLDFAQQTYIIHESLVCYVGGLL